MRMSILLVASLFMASPSAVQAATFLVTYTGTVTSGIDVTGEFGSPAATLDGLAYSTTYRLRLPAVGSLEVGDGVMFRDIFGGTASGVPSPISGSLTINGITQLFPGRQLGEVLVYNNADPDGLDLILHQQQDEFKGATSGFLYLYNEIRSTTTDFIFSLDFAEAANFVPTASDSAAGRFSISVFERRSSTPLRVAFGDLSPTSISIQEAPSIPEPATWAMMICGFGLAGAAMRRRRERRAVAA